MFWYIVLGIVVYLLSCVAWFWCVVGQKIRKNKWYDYIFAPGTFLMATIVGLFNR